MGHIMGPSPTLPDTMSPRLDSDITWVPGPAWHVLGRCDLPVPERLVVVFVRIAHVFV